MTWAPMGTALTALLVIVVASVTAEREENTGRLLAKASEQLMGMPLNAGDAPRDSNVEFGYRSYEVEQPHHDDLAASRLQAKLAGLSRDLWNSISDPQRLRMFESKPGGAKKEVLRRFASALQGDAFALEQLTSESRVFSVLKRLSDGPDTDLLSGTWQNMTKVADKVNLHYSYLDSYMSDPDYVADNALEDYARSIIEPGSSQTTSMQAALQQLHNLSVPNLEVVANGFLRRTLRSDIFYKLFLAINGKTGDHLCDLGQSPHQLIYNLYNIIALAEIKGYAMIQFSYMMLKLYNRGNFTLESDLARKSFELQATEKLLAVKGILPNMARDYWRCDAKRQVEGKTYIRMTQLLQGVIENEVDLNSLGSCKDQCSSYVVSETQGCFKNLFCAKQRRCNGRLYDCTFYDADAWVCMSGTNPERRYDWIEYEDGTMLGRKSDQCINKIKVDSWWRWAFWHCSYCLCKCDDGEGPDSDRYWSLKPVVADVDQNMVVTGVKFVKKDRVIQLEIEQGEALPEGRIREETREWKPAPPVSLKRSVEDKDYMKMSYEQRALDTDRLEAPPGHVVTGVRMRNIGGHINLEAQVTPIQFTDGTLANERSTWIGNDNTPVTEDRRRQVDILMPDVPTAYHGSSTVDTGHNQFIMFDATDAHKDVMQTTIPYIDAQPVNPKSGSWLAGVGFYHKGRIGYGGYVGVSIKTFDFSRHLLPSIDPSKDKEELKMDLQREARERPLL